MSRCCDCIHWDKNDPHVCNLTENLINDSREHQCTKFIKRRGYEDGHCCCDCTFCIKKEDGPYCSVIDQRIYFGLDECKCNLFEKKKKKVDVPCYVAVRKFYKCWIEANEDVSRSEIEGKLKTTILEDPENVLTEEDPDIDLEEQDIDVVRIDWDGIQPCDDD